METYNKEQIEKICKSVLGVLPKTLEETQALSFQTKPYFSNYDAKKKYAVRAMYELHRNNLTWATLYVKLVLK